MSLYQEHRNQIRERIIGTSVALFKEKGFESVTIDDITKTVGVAKGTFYNFFASKAEILILWGGQVFQSIHRGPGAEGRSVEECLACFVEKMVATIKEDQRLFVSMLEVYIITRYTETKDRFDFKAVLAEAIAGAEHADAMEDDGSGLKLKILSRAMLLEMLQWFYIHKSTDGLDDQLKKVVGICLHGLLAKVDASMGTDKTGAWEDFT